MNTLETALEALRKHIEQQGGDSVFDSPVFEEHEKEWEALEKRLGNTLPEDLRKFYQTCDGFTDNCYTCFVSLREFIDELNKTLDGHKDGDLFVASVGDGSGLDDKWIIFLLGEHFRDGEPKFMILHYLMDYDKDMDAYDIELNKSYQERIVASYKPRFEEELPPRNDELVWYGPATIKELVIYILEKAKRV